MRLAALGPDAWEIDLVGVHYEALRLLTAALGLHPPLMPVKDARLGLQRGYLQDVSRWDYLSPKRLLNYTYTINSDSVEARKHLQQGGLYFLTGTAEAVLSQVDEAKAFLLQRLERVTWYRPDTRTTRRNWLYFLLEAVESFIARRVLQAVLPTCGDGVVWLQAGLYTRHSCVDIPTVQQAIATGLHELLASVAEGSAPLSAFDVGELVRAESLRDAHSSLVWTLFSDTVFVPRRMPWTRRYARSRALTPATEANALTAHRKRVAKQEEQANKRHCRGIKAYFRSVNA